jgi:hypothetical protein
MIKKILYVLSFPLIMQANTVFCMQWITPITNALQKLAEMSPSHPIHIHGYSDPTINLYVPDKSSDENNEDIESQITVPVNAESSGRTKKLK